MIKPYKYSVSQWLNKRFCSSKCFGESLTREKITFECQLCHKIITKRTRNDWKNRFCSKQCAGKAAIKIATEVRDFNGENNPSWKGGITSENRKQRNKFLKEIHKAILKRDNYTYAICGIRGTQLQVDHIKPWSEDIVSRFEPDNCRTLCVCCHYKHTFGYPMPKGSGWGKRYENRDI